MPTSRYRWGSTARRAGRRTASRRASRWRLRAILASTEFLFRIERDRNVAPDAVYRISDVELASRLSFFLWSSIPDEELLDAGARQDAASA